MRTALCDLYGIDTPIFGFSHSPAVVAAVSKAGGFGVLGASGYEPEEFERSLTWLAQQCTGKPARQLRSAWTDEWEDPANPEPLPMPLHTVLTAEARARIEQDAARGGTGSKQLINYFVGQSVGMLNQIRPAAEVLREMNAEGDAVLKRMSQLTSEDSH